MNPDESLGSLWEGYLLKMATLVIDSASASDQTKLINIISEAILLSGQSNSVEKKRRWIYGEALTDSPWAQLESQWKAALRQSPSPQQGSLDNQDVLLRRWFLLYQGQIESIQRQLNRMDCLIERLREKPITTSLDNQLLTHYQSIQARFATHLKKLVEAQDNRISRPNT